MSDQKGGDNRPFSAEDIVRYEGQTLQLPAGMSPREARRVLMQLEEQEEMEITITEKFSGFLFDVALAMAKSIRDIFGFVLQQPQPGFFGDRPPEMIGVEIDRGQTIRVPWGRISLPGLEGGYVYTSADDDNGRIVFELRANVKKKYEAVIQKLVQLTRHYVATESIYRGKAIEVNFLDEDGDVLPFTQIRFLDVTNPVTVIFSREIEETIADLILNRIENRGLITESNIGVKEGIVLAGKFGVGKTLLAKQVAYTAARNGWTFIYIRRPQEFIYAWQLAEQYQPAVIFAEDLDLATGRNRTMDVNDIMNTIDGVDSKEKEILSLFTTNNLDEIFAGMLRGGRVGIILELFPPDAEAAERLIRLYGGESLAPNVDLTEVSRLLDGQIAARVQNAVERAQLVAIRRTGVKNAPIYAEDLLKAAKMVLREATLINPPRAEKADPMREFGHGFGSAAGMHLATVVDKMIADGRTNNGSEG